MYYNVYYIEIYRKYRNAIICSLSICASMRQIPLETSVRELPSILYWKGALKVSEVFWLVCHLVHVIMKCLVLMNINIE